MSKKGPSSPGKDKLIEDAKKLPKLQHNKKPIVFGAQSLVIEEGHNHVLLVTRYAPTGKKIELLRKILKDQDHPLIEIPTHVGTNVDVLALLSSNSDPSLTEKNRIKKELGLPSNDILKENVVYRLPKHDGGNLDNLAKIRFKEDSIETLRKTLTESINYLHSFGIVHNDICKRNVLISGSYPNLTFRLCDWGSFKVSSLQKDRDKDFRNLDRVIDQVKKMLETKQQFQEKMDSNPAVAQMYAGSKRRKGVSPLKPGIAKEKNDLDSVKLNLLSKMLQEEETLPAKEEETKQEVTKTLLNSAVLKKEALNQSSDRKQSYLSLAKRRLRKE